MIHFYSKEESRTNTNYMKLNNHMKIVFWKDRNFLFGFSQRATLDDLEGHMWPQVLHPWIRPIHSSPSNASACLFSYSTSNINCVHLLPSLAVC